MSSDSELCPVCDALLVGSQCHSTDTNYHRYINSGYYRFGPEVRRYYIDFWTSNKVYVGYISENEEISFVAKPDPSSINFNPKDPQSLIQLIDLLRLANQ